MTYPRGEWGKEIRKICDALNGTCAPSPGGHYRVTFSNGKHVTIPATPSDRRGKKNTILDCERAAGRRLPRQKTGKFTFKRPQRTFADAPPSRKSDATLRNDAKMARLQEIDRTITRWLDDPPSSQEQAEKLLVERGALVDDLQTRGLDVPEHYSQPVTDRDTNAPNAT